MTSAKEDVKMLLDKLPDDVSYEDIQYHIYVVQKVRRAMAEVEKGHFFTQEEMEQRMAKWLAP